LDARNLSDANDVRLLGIIRSAMEAIITIDETQRVVLFNPMAERLFGCKSDDVMGAPLERLIPERYRKPHHGHEFGRRRDGDSRKHFSLEVYSCVAQGISTRSCGSD
jgi:two-component system sensor histidine kinase UhpB